MINAGGFPMKRTAFAIVASLALGACTEEPAPEAPAVDTGAGRAIVEAECSGCHGLDGKGRSPDIPNLAGQPADYLVGAMLAYRDDRRHHAALQDLISNFREAEIRNIAAYFAGLPPIPPEAVAATADSDQAYREGAEVAAVCTDCHGEGGFSTTPGMPSLAGQQPVYLIVATQEYADGSRGDAGKEAMLQGLDQVDIEKMAMYFASQSPQLREPPPFGDPSMGEPLTAVCGGCHGARGVSDEPMIPNLAGQEPNYLVEAIKAYRSQERSHEDMVTDKSDQEIEHIAAYYSVQSAGTADENGEPIEAVVAKCDRCHGHAVGDLSIAVPNLHGQKPEYLLRVMKQYRDEHRGSSLMHTMSARYDDALLEDLANWYASHPAEPEDRQYRPDP
jgi:cytochrome c553